ncbi:MAG: hypothetical protein LBK57_03845 [Clostridiales Family XIII bacterium]|jgi:putative membrane protein|nr:hypothetical protein [Clostridiales Family XIII bacterium]
MILSNRFKQLVVAALVGALLLSLAYPAASVATTAANENTAKQEVVYIMLNSDGSADKIYTVNIFDVSEDGRIVDYGDYTALRNMTSADEIVFDNQTVTIDTKARKLYYEGTLNNNTIPWNFKIRYFLDGVEYKAEDIAGMSGALEITAAVRQNPECASAFFENYAIQASFTFDTKLCSNIVAKNAVAVNVGRKRQLTYTVLPGKDADIAITADVTDFEMDAAAINGVPLSMNVDIDDKNTVEIRKEAGDLQKAAIDLDDGATELTDGTIKLKDGAGELSDGVAELRDGAKEFTDGTTELESGAKELRDGALDLRSGAKELDDGAADLKSGARKLTDGASNLDNGAKNLLDGAAKTSNGAGDLKIGAANLNKAIGGALTDGAAKLDAGITDAAAGALEIRGGADDLRKGAGELNAGARALCGGLDELSAQSDALNAGARGVFVRIVKQAEIQLNQRLSTTSMPAISLTPENYNAVITGLLVVLGDGAHASDAADIMNLKTGLDEYGVFYAGLKEYTAGVNSAAAGAASVSGGALSLSYGAEKLGAGADALYDGLVVLKKGGNDMICGVTELRDGSAKLLSGAITLRGGTVDLHRGAAELRNGTKTLLDGAEELKDGSVKLKDGSGKLYDGATELCDGAAGLYDGAFELKDGAAKFMDGTADMADGAEELKDGTTELLDGMIELRDGTFEFRDKTAGLDVKLTDKIKTAIKAALGGDFNPVSFVSSKNTNIEAVQFVMKTPAIEKPAPIAAAPPAPKKPSLWQKFIGLFGF